jgi:uncharacterized membrane protein
LSTSYAPVLLLRRMLRENLGVRLIAPEPHFRWRGGEITRLEAFTDAVFAFAVTLLVVSLEVPRTFTELAATMKGFVAFGVCFGLLTWVWHNHYLFSRRFGLQTAWVISLNSLLIFVVLFYVYPLKFLFTMFVGEIAGTVPRDVLQGMITEAQVPQLFVVYCLGYTAVFAILGLLNLHAYRLRAALGLDEYETLATRFTVQSQFGYASVGVVVMVVALLLPASLAGVAGLLFFLNAVIGWGFGRNFRRSSQRILAQRAEHASPGSGRQK